MQLSYNSGSYLESLYTQDLPVKSISSPPTYSTTVNSSLADVGEARGHLKPDGRLHIPEAVYRLPKSDKAALDSHSSAAQYSSVKLPSYQDSYQGPLPPVYNISNKQPQLPTSYLNQATHQKPDPTTKVEQILHNPKQTLHYGQRPLQQNPRLNHSQYQDSIPNHEPLGHHQQQQPQQQQLHHQIASPIPVHPNVDQLRGYPGAAPMNPSPAYNQFHKITSQPSAGQIHAPVPARPVPVQPGFNMNSETSLKPCYLCGESFNTEYAMAEHIKNHIKGVMSQPTQITRPQDSNLHPSNQHSPQISTKPPLNATQIQPTVPHQPGSTIPQPAPAAANQPSSSQPNSNKPNIATKPAAKPKPITEVNCKVCSKSFQKSVQLAEHMKTHTTPKRFQCKYCKKSYKSQERCRKHEVFHQRDVRLVYCELCNADFEFKANYLHHVHTEHDENSVYEPKVGVKKAIPLTGGSIDRSFESEESDSDRMINCQICEMEVERNKLVKHLQGHTIYQCDKCHEVYIQKTEYVAHLMSKHRAELEKDMMDKKAMNVEKLEEHGQMKGAGLVGEGVKDKTIESGKNLTPKSDKKKVNKSGAKGIVYDDDDDDGVVKPNSSENSNDSMEAKKFICSKCGKSFSSKFELTEHAGTHFRDPNRYYCEVCGSSYHKQKEKGYYIYHMKYHSDAELMATDLPIKLICNLCSKPYPKESLVTHIKRDHALYSCDICEWSYSAEKVLVSHMRRIHPKTHKNYTFEKKDYVDTVLEYKPEEVAVKDENESGELDESKLIPCKICDRRFSKKQYYERHMRSSHGTIDDVMIHCELCNTVFSCKGAYFYHILHHRKLADENENVNNAMDIVEDLGKSEGIEIDNSETKAENEDNSACSQSVNKDETDSKENDEANPISETSENSPNAPAMETVLNPITGEFEEVLIEPKEEKIELEVKSVDSVESDDKASKVMKESNEATCKVCHTVVKKVELAEHIRSHPLFSCDLCEFSFLKKQKLVGHRQSLHLDEYIADEIKMFEVIEGSNNGDSFKGETESVDGEKDNGKRKRGAKLLNCSLCNKELKQDKYVEHLKSHIRPTLYCEFCQRKYTKQNLLKMHEKSHERISHFAFDLPYPKLCPFCDAKMESREGYVVHLRTHKRKGPYECKECPKVFTSEKTLENHMKVYHDSSHKVFWKGDGEGLNFNLRTGRVSEIVSDHLAEIREINELLKQNGRLEILHEKPPRKVKERSSSAKSLASMDRKNEEENDEQTTTESEEVTEEEEKQKTDTSDEEYVPDEGEKVREKVRIGKRRSSRLADKADDDDEESDDDDTEDSQRGSRKRNHRKGRNKSKTSEERSEDGPKRKHGRKLKQLPLSRTKRGNYKVVKKATKILAKKKLGRLLRSTLEKGAKNTIKMKPKAGLRKRKDDKSSGSSSAYSQSQDGEDFPEKCPVCGTFQFSKSSYEEHSRIHTGENPFKCPVCEQSFKMNRHLQNHIEKKHKGYTPKNLRKRKSDQPETSATAKLRTRAKNIEQEDLKPVSSSTPKRSRKLVIKLSPLELDQSITSNSSPNKSTSSSTDVDAKRTKSGEYICDVCKKVIGRKWNYLQHMKHHEKEDSNSSGAKKKEEESKPFSCKDCSEAFKKKRDLYIHEKIHQNDGNAEDQDSAKERGTPNRDKKGRYGKKPDQDEANTGDGDKVENGKVDGRGRKTKDVVEDSEEKKSNGGGRKRSTIQSESDASETKGKKAKTQNNTSASSSRNSDSNVISGKTSGDSSNSSAKSVEAGGSGVGNSKDNSVVENSQEDRGCDDSVGNSDVQSNSTDDVARLDNSDADEKKLIRTQSITKISAERALQKWRQKVMDTLNSQLELNAAKKQEKLENPEIARVKEKLSTKTKSEVKNFECRICGDKFNAETLFRKHMEEHLYESPPYCSICDIYFMAIYPKKRLADHNRKKHPIVM